MNRRDRRKQIAERPACNLTGRPGETCPEIPESLLDEIAKALQIPRDRLEVGRGGVAILAERSPVGKVVER